MALVNEGFSAYAVRGEGLPSKVEELVTQFIMTCNGDTYVSTAKSVTYGYVMREAVIFILKVRGGNIIMCAQKPLSSVDVSTVPVTIILRTVIQEPKFLSYSMGRAVRRVDVIEQLLEFGIVAVILDFSCHAFPP